MWPGILRKSCPIIFKTVWNSGLQFPFLSTHLSVSLFLTHTQNHFFSLSLSPSCAHLLSLDSIPGLLVPKVCHSCHFCRPSFGQLQAGWTRSLSLLFYNVSKMKNAKILTCESSRDSIRFLNFWAQFWVTLWRCRFKIHNHSVLNVALTAFLYIQCFDWPRVNPLKWLGQAASDYFKSS